MSKEDVEEAYGFDARQADYYGNAAAYLGLVKREAGRGSAFVLTDEGSLMVRLPLARRNRLLAESILRHAAFREAFQLAVEKGCIPEKSVVREILLRTNPGLGSPDGDTYWRRASTVRHWVQWLLELNGAQA